MTDSAAVEPCADARVLTIRAHIEAIVLDPALSMAQSAQLLEDIEGYAHEFVQLLREDVP